MQFFFKKYQKHKIRQENALKSEKIDLCEKDHERINPLSYAKYYERKKHFYKVHFKKDQFTRLECEFLHGNFCKIDKKPCEKLREFQDKAA